MPTRLLPFALVDGILVDTSRAFDPCDRGLVAEDGLAAHLAQARPVRAVGEGSDEVHVSLLAELCEKHDLVGAQVDLRIDPDGTSTSPPLPMPVRLVST